MFNADDYNENVEYCRYVFEKNEELGLGLTNEREIQLIANRYVDELLEQNNGLELEELYEDIDLLIKVVNRYRKEEQDYEEENAAKIKHEKELAEMSKEFIQENERMQMKNGFQNFTDEYDDHGLDEDDYTPKR